MRMSEAVKSISYLKANAANMIEEINKDQKTYVITQNGEAKVIVQDIKVYEKNQETMAMLKLLAMTRDKSKNAKGIKDTFSDLRNELKSNQRV
jgi:prevent-host-death family protein